MKELRVNLWDVPADCRVITTNGFVKANGQAVMGRGCALEAATKWPDLPKLLGDAIRRKGNVTIYLYAAGDDTGCGGPFIAEALCSVPVKQNWWEKADLGLLFRSVVALTDIVDLQGFRRVVLPRPGCGNGGLDWDLVRPVIDSVLDDRFTVVSF